MYLFNQNCPILPLELPTLQQESADFIPKSAIHMPKISMWVWALRGEAGDKGCKVLGVKHGGMACKVSGV